MELSITSPTFVVPRPAGQPRPGWYGTALTVGIVLVLWALALATSLYWTPQRYIAAALYAIPMLVAAHRLRPLPVGLVASVSVVLDITCALIEDIPLEAWAFNALALLIVGYLSVRSAAERQLVAQRTHEAEDAQSRLQRFMGMVGHDMRTPLFTVLARTQLLSEQAVEPDRSNLLAIEEAAQKMRRFADDLADAARVGSHTFTINPSPIDLAARLRQLAGDAAATSAIHQLVLDLPDGLSGCWDPGRMDQLFGNLLSNAIKYSPRGGKVRVRAAATDGQVEIEVQDEGIGISDGDAKRLFEPFSRLADPAAKGVKGTGLGLYIAKAIAEAQGGGISLTSRPGEGSTFRVTLPR
jgi:signal transduction histidine kinase